MEAEGQQRIPRGPSVRGRLGFSFTDASPLFADKAIPLLYVHPGSLTVQLLKSSRTDPSQPLSNMMSHRPESPLASLNDWGPFFSSLLDS